MTREEINGILELHKKWLDDENGGARARFNDQDLSCKNLSGELLSQAFFNDAQLKCTILNNANLQGADLVGANLFGADLSGANLAYVRVDDNTQGYFLACPSHGSFTGFKKAGGYIVVLEIAEDAKRSSATTYKCRCDKAKVLRIENLDGTPAKIDRVSSDYNKYFIYKVGETVSVGNFDDNRWNECSTGIHFFIDRDLAVIY